jgi:hypothetical protein
MIALSANQAGRGGVASSPDLAGAQSHPTWPVGRRPPAGDRPHALSCMLSVRNALEQPALILGTAALLAIETSAHMHVIDTDGAQW